jgi:hypothetical protein
MADIRERFVEINSAECMVVFPAGRAVLELTNCHDFKGDKIKVFVPHPDVATELILRLLGYATLVKDGATTNGG